MNISNDTVLWKFSVAKSSGLSILEPWRKSRAEPKRYEFERKRFLEGLEDPFIWIFFAEQECAK